jgi:hypothetical protein
MYASCKLTLLFRSPVLCDGFDADMKFLRLNQRVEREKVDVSLNAQVTARQAHIEQLISAERRHRVGGERQKLVDLDQVWRGGSGRRIF